MPKKTWAKRHILHAGMPYMHTRGEGEGGGHDPTGKFSKNLLTKMQ